MEYTPPPSYNSIDLESQAKTGGVSERYGTTALSCGLWGLTTVLSALTIHYDSSGSLVSLGVTIPTLLTLFYVVFHINNRIQDGSKWIWTCISYFPALQLFISALIFFSDRGVWHWFTVCLFSCTLITIVLIYCSWQTIEEWEQDADWEARNQFVIYGIPLMAIAALYLTAIVPPRWIATAYFLYLSVLLSLTTKNLYLNTELEHVLFSNMRINAIMFFMFLSFSSL
ncbi:uncharacterized protein Ecym_2045 [Eremothecium cymbalariae DBVPG|uniref:Uncharacterized protein n=1 Tax=Eremothecium cymbalariae (strain CBS 270.75 / DBVPG 7215 / KCTC 17166 / NRRL Y-17582) TaxID=931890 RepID=G8JP02_ERECY|nr:Hypothetical protein Ecym_2045 [Eremothecium cymbalariae DBVPG\